MPETLRRQVDAQTLGYSQTIELPNQFDGHIELFVGRAPGPGEEVEVLGLRNALTPGGSFACRNFRDADVATVRNALHAEGFETSVSDIQGPPDGRNRPVGDDARVTMVFISDGQPKMARVVATPSS